MHELQNSSSNLQLQFFVCHRGLPIDPVKYEKMMRSEKRMVSGFVNIVCQFLFKDAFPRT
jgi:hypothetical protein